MQASMAAAISSCLNQDIELVRNGYDLPEVDKMANLHGKQPGKAWAGLLDAMIPADIPRSTFDLPVKDTSTRGYHFEQHEIILPHELFSSVYHRKDDSFQNMFLGDEDRLKRFWTQVRDGPQFQSLAVRHMDFNKVCKYAIRLQLHDDGVLTWMVVNIDMRVASGC